MTMKLKQKLKSLKHKLTKTTNSKYIKYFFYQTIKISSITLLYHSCYAINYNTILTADSLYTKGSISSLSTLYRQNPDNTITLYLLAKLSLSHNDPQYAIKFVDTKPDSFLKNSLLHSLIKFYETKNAPQEYLTYYNQLYNTEISINEKCGFDLANLQLGNNVARLSDSQWIVNNDISYNCASLAAYQAQHHQIDQNEINNMLYNLVLNGDFQLFNKFAPNFGISPINFSKSFKHFLKIKINPFITVYHIGNIARNHPEIALSELNDLKVTIGLKKFLINYIAMQFARQQNFTKAKMLFEQYPTIYLSDDEFAWKARVYLYFRGWNSLIKTISDMPDSLKNQDVWLYWGAIAYRELGQLDNAKYFESQIPNGYTYYELLAHTNHPDNKLFKFTTNVDYNFDDDPIVEQIKQDFDLYQTAVAYNRKSLANIAIYQWYYLARIAPDNDKLAMSSITHKNGEYLLSIYAANEVKPRYTALSFPTPFLEYYAKESENEGIPVAYPLAISRQESRFKYGVVAFDGGLGLMQVMPETAQYIIKKAKFKPCNTINPACNIKLGTWYLGNLYHKFNDYIYSTAAYNAGPNRPAKWQDIFTSLDNRVEIELIPIAITRHYVQHVLTNKAVYDAILGHDSNIDLYSYIRNLNQGKHNYDIMADDYTDTNKLTH